MPYFLGYRTKEPVKLADRQCSGEVVLGPCLHCLSVPSVLLLLLLLDGVEMAPNHLVHLEHVYLGLLENGMHLVVAQDLPLVFRVLQLVSLDVFPELLDDLRA